MPFRRFLAAAAAVLSVAAPAQVPPDIAAVIRAEGQTMTSSVGPLYAALFPPEAWEGVAIERDLAYGADPLQTLDVYVPAAAGERRPVLLFVHGGGFRGGDKHGAFYPDNFTLWAAKQGMIGININYRLAPQNPWPAAAEDLAAAIAWTRANAARFGGDPEAIVLMGHSAGANHVADYLAHRSVRGAEAAAVKGAVLLSPHYALAADAGPPFYAPASGPGTPHPYYGHDVALQSLEGSVERLFGNDVPLLLADAEFDPAPMQAYMVALREGLCARVEGCPPYLRLAGHNHFSEGMAVGTSDRSLTDPLLEWIAGLLGERG